jgi:hypothetical protein
MAARARQSDASRSARRGFIEIRRCGCLPDGPGGPATDPAGTADQVVLCGARAGYLAAVGASMIQRTSGSALASEGVGVAVAEVEGRWTAGLAKTGERNARLTRSAVGPSRRMATIADSSIP